MPSVPFLAYFRRRGTPEPDFHGEGLESPNRRSFRPGTPSRGSELPEIRARFESNF